MCLVLFVAVGLIAGCEFKGATPSPANGEQSHATAWAPHPAAMRIYPGTRYIVKEGKHFLEAKIELLDPMGDPLKASGDFRFDLHATTLASPLVVGSRLYSWNISMTTLADQRVNYDPITQGYAFLLEIDRPAVIDKPTLLRATFKPAYSERIKAEARISRDW